MNRTLTPIRVVPHFMRLHEWIALELGLYEAAGLDPIMRDDVMHQVSQHASSPYKARPQDRPFLEGEEVANSACHWGSVCNAAAGMGRFVPDVYGVANFAIDVRPESKIRQVEDLAGVEIGVGTMAGSHFTTLETLERHLPPEQIRPRNVGGLGTLAGPALGAVFFILVREQLALTLGQAHQVVFGALFILVVLALPGGLVDVWTRLRRRTSPPPRVGEGVGGRGCRRQEDARA